jgi:hypothetical protein
MTARNALLRGLVDYAGLFPPAGLGMADAVRNYAAYRQSEHAWVLGRFILPWGRLEEFEAAAGALPADSSGGADGNASKPWPISILVASDSLPTAAALDGFHQRHPGAVIDTVESKPARPEDLGRIAASLPKSCTHYAEIPLTDDASQYEAWFSVLKRRGVRAKIRTGGLTPDAIPSSRDIATFLYTAANARIAFKATAGLHHPLRSEHALTYEAGSPRATMHGFVNLFVAATVAYCGGQFADIFAALEERSPHAFRLGDKSVTWRTHHFPVDHVCSARQSFAVGFGSCSFTEPVGDLLALGWL